MTQLEGSRSQGDQKPASVEPLLHQVPWKAIGLRTVLIILAAALLGSMVNAVHPRGVVWQWSSNIEDYPNLYVRSDAPRIELRDLIECWNTGDCLLLDARMHEDFLEGHIPGALSAPPDEIHERMGELAPFIESAPRLVLYCNGPECDLAERLAAGLREMGITEFSIFEGGWDAWQEAELPVEKGGAP
jgi:rhodanese-related sulfurtransferase